MDGKLITKELVNEALSRVQDPELGNDLVSLNMIKSIDIKDNNVEVTVELTTSACPLKSKIENDCRKELQSISGINNIKINLTAREQKQEREIDLPNIKNIIVISSGKGGVGKSTMAINIARAFSDAGYSTGLMDADIYGPNIPILLNNNETPKVIEGDKILPIIHNGVKFISMGSLLEEGQAVIWRGPMLHGAIKQFLSDVIWGELDYLFVDLPPGTGDVHISLAQIVCLTGAVAVTTPQKLSVSDVKKGIAMFRQMQVNILGIIENMSYYVNPENNEKIYIFGQDGGLKLSRELNIPMLARVPIDPSICNDSESGLLYLKPIVEKLNNSIKLLKENLY